MNTVPLGNETIHTLRPSQRARRARAAHFSALCLAAVLGAFSLSRASAADPADTGAGADSDARFRAYVALLRADLRTGKSRIFNETMKLSNEEAKVFWPIYQDYETEFFALGDRRLALIHQFADVYNKKTLDDATAKALTKDWLKQQEDRLKLWTTYQKRIEKELGAIRAAQFLQIENRLNALTDLMIAAQIPLVEPDQGANANKKD